MISITVYAGAGEIGGNKILIETEAETFFLDFGTPFGQRALFYEEFLKPRGVRGLLDPLSMGLLPPVRGIYRPELELPGEDAWRHVLKDGEPREIKLDGIFLSHAHLDHSGYISFITPDIPVFATTATAFIAKAIQDTQPNNFEAEVCYVVPKMLDGEALKSARGEPAIQRTFKTVDDRDLSTEARFFWNTLPGQDNPRSRKLISKPLEPATTLGSLAIRGFPVDHSIPGASAFGIETEQGWLVYTGDFRRHGLRSELTERFIEGAARLNPQVLVSEGTNADSDVDRTEEEVHQNSLEAVKQAKALVIADFGPRNIERLLTFRKIAEEADRILVITAKDVYLLETLRLLDPAVPDFKVDPHIRVYDEVRGNQATWEKTVFREFAQVSVGADEISKSQADYILSFSFWDLNELPDIAPEKGSVYVYSTSEPYTEEQQISLERLRNWLNHFEVIFRGDPENDEHGFHTSGHIAAPELIEAIREINPRYLVPVHTEDAKFFQESLDGEIETLIPEQGKAFEIPA